MVEIGEFAGDIKKSERGSCMIHLHALLITLTIVWAVALIALVLYIREWRGRLKDCREWEEKYDAVARRCAALGIEKFEAAAAATAVGGRLMKELIKERAICRELKGRLAKYESVRDPKTGRFAGKAKAVQMWICPKARDGECGVSCQNHSTPHKIHNDCNKSTGCPLCVPVPEGEGK
jgi:uncharacterized membrane protein